MGINQQKHTVLALESSIDFLSDLLNKYKESDISLVKEDFKETKYSEQMQKKLLTIIFELKLENTIIDVLRSSHFELPMKNLSVSSLATQ
ncbi:MAG: hypothetical protein NXI23_08040 [Bacteroidetes bacterium]|jgi:hypothetical protein|nr:hypothetical protein [Bacteroidota bacterium]MDF1868437.1 hypothetical protein [Saprospiraceae bacterium]